MRKRKERAFSLVEVALALGIAAFALVAVFGLLPLGVTSNQNSVEQTIAAGVATAVVTDLRATPVGVVGSSTAVNSPVYKIPIPGAGGGVSTPSALYLKEDASVQAVASSARYQVNVTLTPPATGQRTATMVRLLVTWPATSAPTGASGSFEVVTALNRN